MIDLFLSALLVIMHAVLQAGESGNIEQLPIKAQLQTKVGLGFDECRHQKKHVSQHKSVLIHVLGRIKHQQMLETNFESILGSGGICIGRLRRFPTRIQWTS